RCPPPASSTAFVNAIRPMPMKRRTLDNSILHGTYSSRGVLDAWKERAPEKIRSNAVHGLEYFVGSSPEAMHKMIRKEQDAYAHIPSPAPVELPERRKGAVLGLGGDQADAEWRKGASEATTDALRGVQAH
ncbi:hypothetical protein, partial [Paracoccus indicus]|uniref:hypothetical protein n=1 Tax=Paracoccus indicus TaxID=2079229 RepID=UPI001B8B1AFD